MIVRKLLLLILLFLVNSRVSAQQDKHPLGSRLETLSGRLPSVTIYLQTSKGIYETAEDLWFKAYLLDAQYLTPSLKDSTLYVQLIDRGKYQVALNAKFSIENGFVSGHLLLPDSLIPGDYMLSAYSSNALYSGKEEFKSFQPISIVSGIVPSFQVTARQLQEDPANVTLVVEARSKQEGVLNGATVTADVLRNDTLLFSIKANETNGIYKIQLPLKDRSLPYKVKLNTFYNNETVTSYVPIPAIVQRFVQFNLFPESGNLVNKTTTNVAFKAIDINGEPIAVTGTVQEDGKTIVRFKSIHDGMGKFRLTPVFGKKYTVKLDSNNKVYEFPAILNDGLVLSLERSQPEKLTFVVSKSPGSGSKKIIVAIQIRGVVCGVLQKDMDRDSMSFTIPTERLPQGIAEVTLLNSDLTPIAERLVYINPNKKLHIDAKISKTVLGRKERSLLVLKVVNDKGEPVVANLGVSIYDGLYDKRQGSSDILSSVHLDRQLKGRIYNPLYYFDEHNKDRIEYLDLLLNTQGWRRYVWSIDNLQKTNQGAPIIKSSEQVHLKKAVDKPFFMMAFAPEKPGMKSLKQMMRGSTLLNPADLKLGGTLYLKLIGDEQSIKSNELIVANSFEKINNEHPNKIPIFPIDLPEIADGDKQVQQRMSGGIKLNEVVIKGRSESIKRDKYLGSLDSLSKLNINSDYVGACGILNCPACGSGTKPVEGISYSRYVGNRTGLKHPFSFTANEVRRERYQYPQYSDEELMRMYHLSRTQGYKPIKEFYQPDYDKFPEERQIFDNRNTLLWNPRLITGKNGEATAYFFCSDLIGKFIISIEGIDDNGWLGSQRAQFHVSNGQINK